MISSIVKQHFDQKLDSNEAYRAILRLLPTSESFAILTDIGTVVVEIVENDFDAYDPVKVYLWDDAPNTNFYKRAKLNKEEYTFYCRFGLPKKNHLIYRRYFAAELIVKMMFYAAMKDLPGKVFIAATTKKFLHSVAEVSISCDQLAEEFISLNYSSAAAKDKMAADIAIKYFEYKESEIDHIINKATNIGLYELSVKTSVVGNAIYSNFEIFVFGITRLLQNHNKINLGGVSWD